jgi:DNA-binding NarL/FixJ family response regulator
MVGGELVRTLTVKKHLERILSKLGVENRTAAAGLILDQCTRMKVRIGG